MRLIDADKIFPWYLKAFSADEIGEERAISPEEIRFSMNDIRGNLENVPTEHPHKWIPVSERLPKPFEYVNCTCHSLIDDREDWVVETMYLPIPKEVNVQSYSDWGNIPMLNWGKAEVIAWMHRDIPEPYKAERGGARNEMSAMSVL